MSLVGLDGRLIESDEAKALREGQMRVQRNLERAALAEAFGLLLGVETRSAKGLTPKQHRHRVMYTIMHLLGKENLEQFLGMRLEAMVDGQPEPGKPDLTPGGVN